jgi:hydroxymethylglutaryl-CoA synthase
MELAVDLTAAQYEALHDGRRATGLEYLPHHEFVIDKVGHTDQRQFQDLGIEYYRYVG